MSNNLFLFPHLFRKIGWWIFSITFLMGFYILFINDSLTMEDPIVKFYNHYQILINDIAICGIIIGSIMITCSRTKYEDELIAHIRLNALLIALYINCVFLIVTTIIFNSLSYLNIMIWNLFTIPVLFLLIFETSLFKLNRSITDEK